jgi:hypothetical protein
MSSDDLELDFDDLDEATKKKLKRIEEKLMDG